MGFLLKNASWQSRKKPHKFVCIYHGSPSWLHFSPYLAKLFYTISAKFSKSSQKKLTACSWILFQIIGLTGICRQWWGLHTVLLGPSPALEARAHLGGCSFLSLFRPSTTPFSFFLLLCFLTPFLTSAMIHLPDFWILVLFPNLRQAQPQNKTFSLVPI